MDIITALVLVVAITLVIKIANKFLPASPAGRPFQVCALCAGVSGAWVLLTLAVLTEFAQAEFYLDVITLLMGGTVAGIAYQAEKTFDWKGERSFWARLAIIIIGFYLAHIAVGALSWTTFIIELVALAVLIYLFFIRKQSAGINTPHSQKAAELEEQMKNCC